ncbi:SAV_2336 N-terminal domain-related protein [Actinoplanes utahensis]|uniref:SAV_2336 N-terminal domain-related protein n=1 Tax=Actinoplanes utahensis TaxID=1869 RepID=UPI00068A7F30|nr:SAV_2336 N-terminal domain-related protein [Actinoplanes utahensis]
MIDGVISVLRAAGFEPTWEEVADTVWLAGQITGEPIPPATGTPAPPPEGDPAPGRAPGRPATPRSPPAAAPAPDVPPAALTVPAAPGASWQHGELSFRTPASTALPGARKLGRSLRALKRRVPARTGTVLDEIATADRAADGGLWLPVLRPGTERWLDLAVVVDQSPSMAVWARAVEELRGLLERLGAFRDVRIWLLETGETPVLRAGTASGTSRPRTASPRDLLDPGGRRLILVVSDCVGDGWHTGAVPSLLHLWGGQGPVAIVQVLPQRLWRYTAVRTERVELRSPYPGAPNERLRDAFWAPAVPRTRRRRNAAVQAAAVPVPVVPLETRWLAPWSALVAGAGGRAVPSVVTWVRAGDGQAPPQAPDAGRMTAEERLRQFRAVVSPEAFQLAGYLAAVPLTLPVMRLVQEAMMPGTGQAHLAEVLLTVLERKTPEDAAIHPDDVGYDFADGVRDLLLDTVLGSEVLSVLHTVGDFVGRHSHRGRTFASALLEAPDGDVSAGERAFALVSAATLRRFGPDYTGLADRLEGRPAHVPQPGARLILDVVPIRREDGAELLALRAEGRDRLSVMPVTSDEPALALSRYRPGVEAARSAGRRLHDAITVDPEVRDLLRGRPGTLLAPADSLPWESLCTPDGRFLAVDEGWGVGRFFEHRSSSLPYWPIVGPVRVLAILASPVVTGDAEFEALLQASGPTGGGVQMLVVAVEERILEHARRRSPWLRAEAVPPTVTGLRDLVRSFRPQVVHIFGYAEAGPAPTLELGTRAGMTSRVPSATLQVGRGRCADGGITP